MKYKTYYKSPVGRLTIVAENDALVGLWIEGQKYFPARIKEEITNSSDCKILNQAKSWLDRYFDGKNPKIDELNLAPAGSDFAKRVWKILCEIPYGETMTYGEIAKHIAREQNIPRMSAQAVGGAVSRNPISIIIPCHRVVGANGSLTGYAGGIDKKIKLLSHESIKPYTAR